MLFYILITVVISWECLRLWERLWAA